MKNIYLRLLFGGLLALLSPILIFPQAVSGSLEGTTKDDNNAGVAGSAISITHIDTGQTRNGTTNSDGFFRFEQLPVGNYRILVSRDGFKKVETTAEVRLGSTSTVLLTLTIGALSEVVTVDAGAAQVELATSEISRNVPSRTIDELPVLNRNPAELLQLFPGVPAITQDKNGSFNVGGLRARSTTYNVDGSSNNFDIQSGARTPVVQEAVQEFRAVTNVFSAQYGKGAGAVIDVVLKSGTNDFHGSLFEFHRNSAVGANSFFNNARGLAKPRFISNIYGFTLGGPIKKDKTFFFGSFQGTNLRTEALETLNVPSNSVRSPILTNVGTIISLATNPAVASLINNVFGLLPDCAAATPLCRYVSNQSRPGDEYIFSVKMDHNFTPKDSLAGRYLFRDLKQASNSAVSIASQKFSNRDSNFGVTYRRLFGSRAVNEAIFNYSDFSRDINVDATLPDVTIAGFLGIGGGANFPQKFSNKYFQFLDNFSLVAGSHTIRFGGEILDTISEGFAAFNGRGTYAFAALPAANGTGDPLTNFRLGRAASFTRNQGDVVRRFENLDMSLYIQDDWKVRSNFTLNIGLRYESQFEPSVKAVNTDLKAFPAFDPINKVYTDYNTDSNNIAPVIGFAWDPFGKGKTAIRGGYRIGFDRLILDFYNGGSTLQPPLITASAVQIPQVPAIPLGLGETVAANQGLPVSLMLQPDTELGYAHSYQFSVQQEIRRGLTAEIGYLGTAGRGLNQQLAYNRLIPGTTPGSFVRPDPRFGQIVLVGNDGYSDYNALTSLVQYRPDKNISFTAAYTYSKALDIIHDAVASFGGAGSTVAVVGDPVTGEPNNSLEYGPAVFDRPHAFSSSLVYRLPEFTKNRAAGYLLNGWQVSGIVLLQSGNPFTVLAGADLNRDGINNDRPDLINAGLLQVNYNNPNAVIPRTAFDATLTTVVNGQVVNRPPRVGTLGRNTFRRDSVKNVDMSIAKQFAFTERYRLDLRTEFFNLFNRTQFDQPVNSLAAGNFGQIIGQANSPRNIRFALKFIF